MYELFQDVMTGNGALLAVTSVNFDFPVNGVRSLGLKHARLSEQFDALVYAGSG